MAKLEEEVPLQAVVDAIFTHLFGGEGRVRVWVLLNHHSGYWVIRVHLAHLDSPFLLKIATSESGRHPEFQRTAFIHALLRAKSNIPVTEIVAVDTSCLVVPYGYIVKSFSPGEEWAVVYDQLTERGRTTAFRHLGETIAELHTITFPDYGVINTFHNPDSTLSYGAVLKARAEESIRNPRWYDFFLDLVEYYATLFTDIPPPTLCHDDLHHHNILFHRNKQGAWQLASILDFDKAWAGHAESDMARLDLWEHMMHPALRDAYEAVHHPDPLYQFRRPVYQLLWCLEYASPTQYHSNTTRRVCEELGIEPPLF